MQVLSLSQENRGWTHSVLPDLLLNLEALEWKVGWGSRGEQNFPKEKGIARSIAACTCEVSDREGAKKGSRKWCACNREWGLQPVLLVARLGAPEECGDGAPWTAGVRAVVVEVRGQLIKTQRRRKGRVYWQPEHLVYKKEHNPSPWCWAGGRSTVVCQCW